MIDAMGNWLLAKATPRFATVGLRLLLLFALILAMIPFESGTGERVDIGVTLFSWLPTAVLQSPVFFVAVRCMLVITTLLWFFRIAVPWSCWACVVCFTLMWSLRMENVCNGAHIFNVTNMLLVIYAMWYQFYHVEIHQSHVRGDYSQTPLFPRWAFLLILFYLGWFHSLAGFSKVATSGWGWGDGTSLQLWVYLFGYHPSPSTQLILYDNRLTAILQTGALVIECCSVLCVFNRWIRYAIGIGLFGFYMGVLTTFIDFGFHFNAILVGWFLLPLDWWFQQNFETVGDMNVESNEIPVST